MIELEIKKPGDPAKTATAVLDPLRALDVPPGSERSRLNELFCAFPTYLRQVCEFLNGSSVEIQLPLFMVRPALRPGLTQSGVTVFLLRHNASLFRS